MTVFKSLIGGCALLASAMVVGPAGAKAPDGLVVRIAELEIDPAQLTAYEAMLAEEQEASIRLEPGVLMLHSVALADQPTHIRLLEVYVDKAAYDAHIRSAHFQKYKTGTAAMVRSLALRETRPIRLCAKDAQPNGDPCMKTVLPD